MHTKVSPISSRLVTLCRTCLVPITTTATLSITRSSTYSLESIFDGKALWRTCTQLQLSRCGQFFQSRLESSRMLRCPMHMEKRMMFFVLPSTLEDQWWYHLPSQECIQGRKSNTINFWQDKNNLSPEYSMLGLENVSAKNTSGKKRSRDDDSRMFVENDHLKMMMMAPRRPPVDGDL